MLDCPELAAKCPTPDMIIILTGLKKYALAFMLLNTPLYGLICVYNWILVEPLKLLNAQNEPPAHITAQEEQGRKNYVFSYQYIKSVCNATQP